jgi:hypothetical protein
MQRCVLPMLRLGLVPAALCTAFTLAAALPASAQVGRSFPPDALRGELVFGTPPEARLNGQPARLAPGARIRGQDNLLQMSGSLTGQKALVHYTVDPHGLLLDIWILRADEAARRPWPRTPAEAQRWAFDPISQTWTRP